MRVFEAMAARQRRPIPVITGFLSLPSRAPHTGQEGQASIGVGARQGQGRGTLQLQAAVAVDRTVESPVVRLMDHEGAVVVQMNGAARARKRTGLQTVVRRQAARVLYIGAGDSDGIV